MARQKKLVDGTGIELYDQAPWNRATVADGKWLQSETLDPISANDRILASAIDYVSGGVDNLSARIDLLEDATDVINIYGTWNEFISTSADLFDVSAITDNDIIKVLNDPNQYPPELTAGSHQTYFRWMVTAEDPHKPLIPTEGEWNYIGYLDPYYNTTEIDDKIDDLSATVKSEYVPWTATDCPIGDKNIANNYSFAQGLGNSASYDSFTQGKRNYVNGQSIAAGVDNYAKNQSQALGSTNSATSDGFAAGSNNSATLAASFAQGSTNYAYNSSFAQGTSNNALTQSFAQGKNNSANYDAFAQGLSAFANYESLAQGLEVTAESKSFAQGSKNKAKSNGFAQGTNCSAYNAAFTQGKENVADLHAFAQGTSTTAYSYALAQGAVVSAHTMSFAQGNGVSAQTRSLAQGQSVSAYFNSLAQGQETSAETDALAQGSECSACNESLAQGSECFAEDEALAQGEYVSAHNDSLAQGRLVTACDYSLAQGQNNSAINVAQALGKGLIIDGGMAIGKYNKTTDARFVIGNGTDNDHRSDLFWINNDGDTTSIGAAYFTGFSGTNVSGLTQTASIDGLINSAANGGSMTGLKNASELEFQYQDGSTPTAITAALQTSADKLIFVPSSGCADWLKFATDGYDSTDNSQIIKILTPNFQSQIEALDTKKLDVSSLNLRITASAPTNTSAYVGINSIPFQAKYDDMGNVINETYLMEHKFTAWSGSTDSVFSGTSRSAQSAEYFGGKLPSAYMQVANIGRDANGNISSYGGSAIAGLGDYVPKSATDCPIGSNNTAVNIAFAQGTTNSADTTAFAQGDANKSNFESFAQGKANTAANYSLAQGWQSSAERHSMTQGVSNTAYNLSFAQGDLNFADGLSLAQGEETLARWGSIAQGSGTSATNRSQAFGEGTVANASGMAIGTYNKTYDAAFVIGNGVKNIDESVTRSDLVVIDHNGKINVSGNYGGTSYEADYGPSGIHLSFAGNRAECSLTQEGVSITGSSPSTSYSAKWIDIINPGNYVSAMGALPIVISAVTRLPPSLEEGIYYLV